MDGDSAADANGDSVDADGDSADAGDGHDVDNEKPLVSGCEEEEFVWVLLLLAFCDDGIALLLLA